MRGSHHRRLGRTGVHLRPAGERRDRSPALAQPQRRPCVAECGKAPAGAARRAHEPALAEYGEPLRHDVHRTRHAACGGQRQVQPRQTAHPIGVTRGEQRKEQREHDVGDAQHHHKAHHQRLRCDTPPPQLPQHTGAVGVHRQQHDDGHKRAQRAEHSPQAPHMPRRHMVGEQHDVHDDQHGGEEHPIAPHTAQHDHHKRHAQFDAHVERMEPPCGRHMELAVHRATPFPFEAARTPCTGGGARKRRPFARTRPYETRRPWSSRAACEQ